MPYKDISKQREAEHRYYLKNKPEVRDRSKESWRMNVERNKEFVAEYLRTHHCVDCGESNPIVLDFDHVRGNKVYTISWLRKKPFSLKRIQEEIDKCEVRCSNCHRIVTFNRKQCGNK